MLYAINKETNEKIEPQPNIKAKCIYCDNEVHSKCGNIKRWHFAHVKFTDCPSNLKLSDWVLNWKAKFPKEYVDVPYIGKKDLKKYIADIKIENLIIDFQYAPNSWENVLKHATSNSLYVFIIYGYKFKLFNINYNNLEEWQPFNFNTKTETQAIWNKIYKPVIIETEKGLIVLDNLKRKGTCKIIKDKEYLINYILKKYSKTQLTLKF